MMDAGQTDQVSLTILFTGRILGQYHLDPRHMLMQGGRAVDVPAHLSSEEHQIRRLRPDRA
jgi:hypothetical protein